MTTETENKCPRCGADLNKVGTERMGPMEFCGSCKLRINREDSRPLPDVGPSTTPPAARSGGQDPRVQRPL